MKIGAGATSHVQVSGVSSDQHHPQLHAPEDHVGTGITATEQETLSDGSDADALHTHPLSALDTDITTHAALGDAHHASSHLHSAHGSVGADDHHDKSHGIAEHAGDLFVVKAADEVVTNSSTLQNDDDLVLAIGANENWNYILYLKVTASTPQDIDIAFSLPSGATGTIMGIAGTDSVDSVASASSEVRMKTTQNQTIVMVFLMVENGANAGSVQLQWAQNFAQGTSTIIEGSVMRGRKAA